MCTCYSQSVNQTFQVIAVTPTNYVKCLQPLVKPVVNPVVFPVELVVDSIVGFPPTHSNIPNCQTVPSDAGNNTEKIINKVSDRCRDEVKATMKEQFIIFSDRLTITELEFSHVSSRVDLLESQSEVDFEILKKKKTESKMELGTQTNISDDCNLSSQDMSCLEESNSKRNLRSKKTSLSPRVSGETCYKQLRSGNFVGNPKP